MKKLNYNQHYKYLSKCLLIFAPLFLFPYQVHAYINNSIKAKPPYHLKSIMATREYVSGLTPMQVLTAYTFSSIPNQGAGQTIALVDAYDNPLMEQDLAVFSAKFNLPACTIANKCFSRIYASGTQPTGDFGWGLEMSLDVEWAHAIAPQANIMVVEAASDLLSDLFAAVSVAIKQGATIVSMSWGANEFQGENNYDALFNIPNVIFTAASGDSGNGIWYPAASPYVVGVGGTTLNVDSAGNYLSETAWSGSGGGISTLESEPLYQANLPLPNNPNHFRGEPDVSYGADPNTGFAIYDTYGYGGWMVIGGTSAGAPQWAGLFAIVQSSVGLPIQKINTQLYNVAMGNSYQASFHDITTGSNGSCGTICNASEGYDYVTGLGSPQASSLVKALIGAPPPTDPAQQLQADFRKTRLGVYATCTATSSVVTCVSSASTPSLSSSTTQNQLSIIVSQNIASMQSDVIAVNPKAYAQLNCQLQPGSLQIWNSSPTTLYATFNALCQDPLPFPT